MTHPRPSRRRSLAALFASLLAGVGSLAAGDAEDVTLFPSYGYRTETGWRIPLRVWVHEPRSLAEAGIVSLLTALKPHSEREQENLRRRLGDLIADDESGEAVRFRIDGDPRHEEFFLTQVDGTPASSDLNGLITGELKLSADRAAELPGIHREQGGWLRLHAVSGGHHGEGAVRLIPPQGRSLVSDIDDTVKVTNIPAGRDEVLENTFFRDFPPAPGMAERYLALPAETAFHYVSGGPWQLYRPLAEFLAEHRFPAGSMQMKSVRKHLLTPGSWEDLAALVGGNATYEQKLEQIGTLLRHFPERRFLLVGDSGEKDPEVYREIRRLHPNQVEAIWIRDLVNARTHCPQRLEGMEVIEAATVVERVSPCL